MDMREDNPLPDDALLTLDEAAALLKVAKSWIYERTRQGTIPHIKLGKYLRFPVGELRQWLTAQVRPRTSDLLLFRQRSERNME